MQHINKRLTKYFLGANSPDGFFSLYGGFTRPSDGDFLYTIKGGPGCGKSTFMKRLGAAAGESGLEVEYIYCSGDPDSLDGVYIPALHTAYCDGTAPHVTEPGYTGAAGLYLDLGRFYDRAALKKRLCDIAEVSRSYKALYDRAYATIAAARALDIRGLPGLAGEGELAAIKRRAAGVAAREFRQGGGMGRKTCRLLSALTCKGEVFYAGTVAAVCERVYALDNELGLAEPYLREIEAQADKHGLDAVICPDPLATERLEAVLLPSLSLGFVARRETELHGEVFRHVRLDAMADREAVKEKRVRLRGNMKLRSELLEDAVGTLAEAKALHDELERIYNPHVDFAGVHALANEHIKALLI